MKWLIMKDTHLLHVLDLDVILRLRKERRKELVQSMNELSALVSCPCADMIADDYVNQEVCSVLIVCGTVW